jgi:hypothetical protein
MGADASASAFQFGGYNRSKNMKKRRIPYLPKKSSNNIQSLHQIIIGYNDDFNASTEYLFSKSVPTLEICRKFDNSFIPCVGITAHFLPLPA